jgi:hypothetical protein
MLFVLGFFLILVSLLPDFLEYQVWWNIIIFHIGMCCISFAFMVLPKGYLAIAVHRSAFFHLGIVCLFLFNGLSVVGIDSIMSFISFSTEIGIKFNETNSTCHYGIFIGLIGFFIPDEYFAILLRVHYDPSSEGKKYQRTKEEGLFGIILSRLTVLFIAVAGGSAYMLLAFLIHPPLGILFGGMGYVIIFGFPFLPDVQICCSYQNLGGSKKVRRVNKTDDKAGGVSDYGDESSGDGGGCGGGD